MLKPSDFNNAVPQFQNGNYASNPINPQYVEEPSSTDYNRGTEPLQTLPAQWWNWFMNKFTSRFNKVNIYVKNLFNELAQLLSLVNVTPDGTESSVTDGQLKNAFKELYPNYINTKLALEATYVKKTQKVNNHALSGDITVSKTDVGLGNVPNVSTNDQTPTYTKASTLTALSSGEKLSIAFGKIAKAVSSLISHIANVSNPHSVTKAQVGLGNVVNTGDSATPVENGTTKFTTGGAYTLKKDLTDIAESLPTDAVLHYSFDEVPDYPDGTADVRLLNNNTYDIQSTNYAFSNSNGTTFSNSNGNLVATITNGPATGCSVNNTYIANKILKFKIKITAITGTLRIYNGLDTGQVLLKEITAIGDYEIEYLHSNSAQFPSLYFRCVSATDSASFTLEQIYIGDGSYNTPIIDNANGQNNATNNGGIATNGVSGKGAYFLNRKYAQVSDFNLTDNFTISFWIKPDTDTDIALGNILIKDSQIILRNGVSWGSRLFLYLYQNGEGGLKDLGGLLPKNVWTHFVLSKKGTDLNAYRNGAITHSFTLSNTSIDKNTNPLRLSDPNNTYSQSIDDLLIFNRALSTTEIMALYLNKANTPKYYNINNYILDNTDYTPTQNSTNLVTSGGVYTELAKKVDKTTTVNGHALSGNVTVTKADLGLGNVADKDLSDVVNTGDSATPVSGGTTKFTTGGAYNLLTSLAPIFSTSISYAVGDMVTYSGRLYTCTTAHSAGAWNASHFTVANLNTELQKPANNIAEDFQINKLYRKGHLVIYNKELYKCIQTTNVQLTEWDSTKFQKVSMYTKKSDRATSLTRYVLNVSLGGQSHSVRLPALCAGSELFIRLDNDNNSSGEIELQAYHAYTLGVTYSDGGMSTLQKLTSGQELSITVAPNSYLEVSVNYIDVDEEGLANLTMFTYPIPSVDNS
jgi:hypothetical protein